MLTFHMLPPTQRSALADAALGNLVRCNGGFKRPGSASPHTVRTLNMLQREQLIEFADPDTERRVLRITKAGRDLVTAAQHATPAAA